AGTDTEDVPLHPELGLVSGAEMEEDDCERGDEAQYLQAVEFRSAFFPFAGRRGCGGGIRDRQIGRRLNPHSCLPHSRSVSIRVLRISAICAWPAAFGCQSQPRTLSPAGSSNAMKATLWS